ncbi:MAG: hypothetical protein GF331_04500 [Chitinivibrionales bacterium]|nr:hypothetical protein [Chitinivibrionales bacterium]
MRYVLGVLALAAVTFAQLPEFNMLVVVDHGVVAERPQNGLYHYNTATKDLTRLWPPQGTTAGWSEAVKAAWYSPDMSRIAFYLQRDRLAICDRDGGNPRLQENLGRAFKVSDKAFTWTEQGIFWYDKDTYELLRYVPETEAVTVVCTLEYLPNTTSFGGVHASRDGSRLWSWLTLSATPEENPDGEQAKPFIYIDDNDYDNPRIRYAYKWGHANMMLPDGSKTLHIGWEFSNNTHPYIWIWNWDTFSQDSTLTHGVDIKATRNHRLVQVANSNEWMGLMFEDSANYMWQFAAATSGAQPILMDLNRRYYDMAHAWLGPYPDVQGVWHIIESRIELAENSPTDTIHLTNWSDAADPTVHTDKAWTGAPVITKNGSDVSIVFTVSSGPALPDTAVVTITDAAQQSKTCSIVWAPSQSPAEQLAIVGTADETSVTLTWQNTLGPQFSFGVQKSTGSSWGPMLTVDTTYTDNSPEEGDNTYRVAAITSGDTSYQQVTVYYSAPESITILAPSGGRQFAPGEQVLVQWSTVKVPSVQISVSDNDGETFVLMVDSAIDNGDDAWSNFTLTLPSVVSDAVIIKVHPYQQSEPFATVNVATVGSAVLGRSPMGHAPGAAAVRYLFDLSGRRMPARKRSLPASPALPAHEAGVGELVIPVRER